MNDITVSENEAGADSRINEWLAEATPESAGKLESLASATDSRETRKAARRALYRLSQRGIVPENSAGPATLGQHESRRAEAMRAWASAYDGAGNRLILLVFTAADGGNATVAQVLANDELGIRDLSLERRRPREIAPLMERLEGRIDDGLAVAEIEPDYARQVIERFRKVNLARCKTTPAGFIDLLPRIGVSEQTVDISPVYAYFDAEKDEEDDTVPRDPADLFKLPWFDPWFFAVEDVTPWLGKWMEAESSVVITSEKARQERKSSLATEAAGSLISEHMRDLYTTRLEESADVLRRRGRITGARQALFHAAALKSEAAIGEVPFAEALAARTLEAAAQMVAAQEQERAGEPGEPGE